MENTFASSREKIAWITEALRDSEMRTRRYFKGSLLFYSLVIALLALLALTASKAEARNAFIAFIVLSYLGMNGLWISALRGLRGTGITAGTFLNLFHLPVADEITSLADDRGWKDEDARLRRAEELLERQAAAEKEHRAWPNRALSLAVITVIDLLVWLVWNNPAMALVNQAIAMAISQIHISLGPRASLRALEELKGSSG